MVMVRLVLPMYILELAESLTVVKRAYPTLGELKIGKVYPAAEMLFCVRNAAMGDRRGAAFTGCYV